MRAEFAPARGARLVAVVALWAQAAVAIAGAVGGALLAVIGDSDGQADVAAQAVFAAIVALALGALAVGIARSRRWALAPALVWHLLLGFTGAYLLVNGEVLYGSIALAVALAGGVPLALLARDSAR